MYIQDKEIFTVTETGKSTVLGTKIMKVEFKDGSNHLFTEKTLNRIQSDAPIDATELRRRKIDPVAQEVLAVMREADVTVGEVEFLFTLVGMSVDDNFNRASNKLWGVEKSEDRGFLLADAILLNEQGQS